MNHQFENFLALIIISSVFSCSSYTSPIDTEQLTFAFNAEFKTKMIPLSFYSHGDELK